MSPIYEYECKDGHRSEGVHSIEDRNNANCPDCKRAVHIVPSTPGLIREAHTFTTYGHDGRIIGQRQMTDRTPLVLHTYSGKTVNV